MPVIPGGTVELGYAEITANVTISSTTEGSGTTIFSDLSFVSDGSPILVELFSPQARPSLSANASITVSLYLNGSEHTRTWGRHRTAAGTNGDNKPLHLSRRITPSAGFHTVSVKAYASTGSGVFGAGTGTSTTDAPAFLRVSKIIQASQLIVQTPNAPLVASLPSNAIDGQEVRYLADNTNGIIWNFRYRAGSPSSYKWEFIGGSPLLGYVASVGQQTTTGTWQNLSGPSATIPLAGDYDLAIEAGYNDANTAIYLLGIYNGASILRNARIYNTAYGGGEAFLTHRATAVTAATVIRPQYWVGVAQAGGFGWAASTVSATPVRVSA